MKDNTILILAGVGVGGYLLYKSNFFEGLGKISTGLGEGVSGIGEGVSSAFTGTGGAIGEFAQDIEGATENILSLLSPLGATGTAIKRNIEQTAQNTGSLRQMIADKTITPLSDIKAESNINTATEKSLRKEQRQDFYTETQESVLSGIQTYNPLNVLSNFIQNIKKVTSGASITGAATSGGTSSSSSSSIRTTKTSSTSSYSTNSTSKLNFITNDKGVVTGIDTGTQSVNLNPSTPTKKTSKLRTWLGNIF